MQWCKGSQCAAGLPASPTEGTWAPRGQGQRAQWEIRKRSSMGNQETELIGKSGNWAQWGIRNDVILWTLNAKHWQGLRMLKTARKVILLQHLHNMLWKPELWPLVMCIESFPNTGWVCAKMRKCDISIFFILIFLQFFVCDNLSNSAYRQLRSVIEKFFL